LLEAYASFFMLGAYAQIDNSLLVRTPVDMTFGKGMNMDAVYNRPLLQTGKVPAPIGGIQLGVSSYF
jgi:hypothetical protein